MSPTLAAVRFAPVKAAKAVAAYARIRKVE
jgi:hypothetical protein